MNNTATAELTARLGVPLHLMLDRLDGGGSEEQRTADRFVARLRELGRTATTIDFGGPDILTGISLQSIAEVLSHEGKAIHAIAPDDDWKSVAYAAAERLQNLKTWFFEQLRGNTAGDAGWRCVTSSRRSWRHLMPYLPKNWRTRCNASSQNLSLTRDSESPARSGVRERVKVSRHPARGFAAL